MQVLVTGGAGFIGSHVVDGLLARGHGVVVVDGFNDFYDPALKRRNTAGFGERAPVIEADIRNNVSVRSAFEKHRFDAILHLAARAGIRQSTVHVQLYADVNILGTLEMLEFAREFGVKKFVFASSSSVYGASQPVPFREDAAPLQPISPYAATKLS